MPILLTDSRLFTLSRLGTGTVRVQTVEQFG